MIATFTMEAGLVIAAVLAVAGVVQWKRQSGRQQWVISLGIIIGRLRMITHGSAFGGCAAVCADGTIRKDKVALDNILMYGKHPSGKEFTYYIEDQGLEICASDQPEELIIVSKQQPFEIREAGLSRDQGISTKKAVIKQDVTYYIILESKHEISIKATKRC